jgi:hypothetical protein
VAEPRSGPGRAAAWSILYAGVPGGTCAHRATALGELGHAVECLQAGPPPPGARFQLYRVGFKLGRPPDLIGANREIRARIARGRHDLLWIDKGLTIRAATLAAVRRLSPGTRIVAYSPDDMLNPANQSAEYLRGIPAYDLHVTTKSYNVDELYALGARDVLFVDNAFDPHTHRPLELSEPDRLKYRAEVAFVGQFEPERAEALRRLAQAGIPVTVWGGNWDELRDPPPALAVRGEYLEGIDYAKAVNATRINLGFLRKINRDLQTTRSVEIPACRAFLLAERTDEHLRMFREGHEAEFFASFAELADKCRYYLAHDDERRAIAARGHERCLRDGYSNHDRLARVIGHLAARRA